MGHQQSRPYSPSAFSACDVAMSAGQLNTAFEYISKHLARSGIHVTLVVTGRALSVLRFGSTSTTHEVSVIQATPLDSRSLAVLSKLVQKAAIKFEFGVNWIHNSLESKYSDEELDVLATRSLIQNDIVFSAEGLTLLSIDLCFALKYQLGCVTKVCSVDELTNTVAILRRLVMAYRGRPLTKGYISRCYSGIEVSDFALLRVNAMYEWKYGARGIVGVNDEFQSWRREGRVDFDVDFNPLLTDDRKKLTIDTSVGTIGTTLASRRTCKDPTPLIVRYNSTRYIDTGSACSISPIDAARMDNFLREFNTP